MRNYQAKKNNPYYLPTILYKRIIYTLKDHERRKSDDINFETNAIKSAMDEILEEYKKGIMDNILYDKPYPLDADYSTYRRRKQRFIYDVARRLNLIENCPSREKNI